MTPSKMEGKNMRTYLFESPSYRIGKKEWRAVVYDAEAYLGATAFTDYEWRSPAYIVRGQLLDAPTPWAPSREWHSYDSNDGIYGGLPRRLRMIYERHKIEIQRALK